MPRLRPLFLTAILFAAGCAPLRDMPTPAAPAEPVAAASVSTPPIPTLTGRQATPLSPTSVPAASPIPALVGETVIASPSPFPTSLPTPDPSPTPCAEPGRIEFGEVNSAVAGEPMRYRIYLPPCYGSDGRVYPALYMLGGNIHDDAIWDVLGLDEAAESGITTGQVPPLLIVMPDNGWLANTTTSGPSSYEGFVLNELIPHIEATYCAWPAAEGRAVGGLSRGGYWSLMMAFRQPDVFLSVGAHSPALIDSYAGPAEDPAITGVTNDLGDLRIWIDIAERDPYIVQARPLHDVLESAGVPHEWHVNEGTHDEAYWRANLYSYLSWYSDGWRIDRDQLPECATP